MERLVPVLLTVLGMVSIQFGAALSKQLFPQIGPQGAVALRLVFAAVILVAIWRPWRKRVARERLLAILAYGVTLGVMNLAFYLALATVPLGIAVALELIGPLTLALLHSHKRVDLVWVAIAVLGLGVLLPLRSDQAVPWTGVALALFAGACWALYIVFGTKAGQAGRGQAASLGMLTAALVGAPWGIAHAGTALLAPQPLTIGLIVAALSSVIPYTIELYAMSRMPTQAFGVLMSLEPAVAALFGWMMLGERLGGLQWLGVAAVIAASAGSAATARPQPS